MPDQTTMRSRRTLLRVESAPAQRPLCFEGWSVPWDARASGPASAGILGTISPRPRVSLQSLGRRCPRCCFDESLSIYCKNLC
jgi:hypothetical protein